jgi:hypothetical protein
MGDVIRLNVPYRQPGDFAAMCRDAVTQLGLVKALYTPEQIERAIEQLARAHERWSKALGSHELALPPESVDKFTQEQTPELERVASAAAELAYRSLLSCVLSERLVYELELRKRGYLK